jgi:ABC-2 type transport system permease protein
MLSFWLPVATLWQRELIRFWRQKSRVLGVVASPLVFWIIIGSGFGDLSRFFPGALVLTVLFSAIFSTMSIIEDRREGFLLSMLVSPASRTSMVLGKVLGSATLAWIQGLIFLLFAPLAGLRPSAGQVVGLAGTLFLVSFALTALGFAIAWPMESTQGFHAVMNLFLVPMWMVSGAVFPVGSAHVWIRWVMLVNPLTYSVAALTRLLAADPGPGTPALGAGLAVTAAFGGVLLVISAALANRRGKVSSA